MIISRYGLILRYPELSYVCTDGRGVQVYLSARNCRTSGGVFFFYKAQVIES